MAPDQDPPARPRRERPLTAAGREPSDPQPPPPPTVTSPPTGSRVFEPPPPPPTETRADRVDMAFPGPAPQRRWTIALRFFLLIPHFVWLYILNLGMQFALVIAWFAALFTKRVPDEIASFIGKVLRYQLRVMGYGFFLLTDEYPPFGLGDDHAIDLHVNPGEFNRAAVFFRPILMVPSGIVATLAGLGAGMIGVVGWLLALILGRLPQPLWEANAAVLRYVGRTYAFGSLLTAEQPKGLFGDDDATAVAALPEGSDMPDLPAKPRLVRLVLSQGAKRLVALFLVLSAVTYAGLFVTIAVFGGRLTSAYNDLDDAHDVLIADVSEWDISTQRCAFSGGRECLQDANRELADGFAEFADDVADIDFPANLGPVDVISLAYQCESALRAMAAATDEASYSAAAREYQRAVTEFDEEYAAFAGDLEYET